MISFKQFIEEGRVSEVIHTNPSIETLKSIAKNNKHGSARFIIHKDGTVLAGDSLKFTHHDMEPNPTKLSIRGYIDHHKNENGKDVFFYTSVLPEKNVSTDEHPYLIRLQNKGIQSGNNPSNIVEGK